MNIDTIAEGRWESDIAGTEVSGLVHDKLLVRRIKGINIKELPELVEYLRVHTSVKNKDTPSKMYSVTDPMCDGIVIPGTWRGVSVKSVEGVHNQGRTVSPAGTITQVLAWNWATEISWTEARLVENPQLQPLGASRYAFLTVMWPNCASTALEAMAASLLAPASFTDPVINGETKAGVWYNSGVTSKLANDGSGVITLQLSQQYRDIPFYPSSKSADATVETREQLGLTTETPEPMVAVDGQIKSQQITPNQDNSKNIKSNRDTGIAQTNTTSSKSADATVVITEKTVQATPLTDSTPADGTIRRIVNAASKYFNRYTTSETVDTGIEQTSTTKSASPAGVTTITEKTVQVSALPDPVSAKGFIKRIVNRASKYFSRYETIEEIHQPSNQTETSHSQTAFETTTTVLQTENATALPTPTPVVGKIFSNTNTPTEAGNTRTQEHIVESVQQVTTYAAAITDDGTVTTEHGHNVATFPVITAVSGADVSISGDMNEFQKYNYTKETKTSTVPLSCPGVVSWITKGNSYRVNNWQWDNAHVNADGTVGDFYYTSYWIYQETYYHGIAFYLTAATAAAALTTIVTAISGVNVDHGSGIHRAGSNLWMATVQSRKDALISTVTGLDTVWA